jgi:hypothetical protein
MDEAATKDWFSSAHTRESGRPETYSDQAIQLLLTLREIYNLPLRALGVCLVDFQTDEP